MIEAWTDQEVLGFKPFELHRYSLQRNPSNAASVTVKHTKYFHIYLSIKLQPYKSGNITSGTPRASITFMQFVVTPKGDEDRAGAMMTVHLHYHAASPVSFGPRSWIIF